MGQYHLRNIRNIYKGVCKSCKSCIYLFHNLDHFYCKGSWRVLFKVQILYIDSILEAEMRIGAFCKVTGTQARVFIQPLQLSTYLAFTLKKCEKERAGRCHSDAFWVCACLRTSFFIFLVLESLARLFCLSFHWTEESPYKFSFSVRKSLQKCFSPSPWKWNHNLKRMG